MDFLRNLLLTTTPPNGGDLHAVLTPVLDAVHFIANGILGLLALVAVFFIIWVGFKMARADDDSKRQNAKKQLIFAIIGVLVIVFLLIMWNGVIVPEIGRTQRPTIPIG